MRLFIGIKTSEKLQKEIMKWQEENTGLPVRFIRPENLHMTLVPPWYEDGPDDAVSKLKSIKYRKIRVVFNKIVINYRSQVIWAEPENPPEEIFSMVDDLRKLFKSKDTRPYRLHLTVARFKNGKFLQNVRFGEIKCEEQIDNITLFESKLGAKEAIYNKIFSLNPL